MSVGNMVKARVQIRGTRPLLMHAFGPDAIPLEAKERTGVAGRDPEEWRRTTLVNEDGQIYVNNDYIFRTIFNGAKYIKAGRKNMQDGISASLQVFEDRILLDRWFSGFPNGKRFDLNTVDIPPTNNPSAPVFLDIRSVVNPSTKGRNVRYRIGLSTGWQCDFTLLWDKIIISRPIMESILQAAGQLVGLANGRKIGMGRFEVVNVEYLDGDKPDSAE